MTAHRKPTPSFVVGAALAVLALGACRTETPKAPDKPNILWIIAEDLGPELGSYGHPEVRTPHLDRLAGEGVRYTRFFTDAPVCSPSRSSLMTGMHAITIGAHSHRSHRAPGENPLPEGVRLLTHWLRDAGYFTVNVKDPESGIGGSGKDDFNFSFPGKAWESSRWDALATHQPFYAQINYSTTHRMARRPHAASRVPLPADPSRVQIPPYYPDHPLVRQDWAEYLDTIMELDAQVGTVLARLEADGLARSTIVVFIGDNGRTMLRGKQWPYDSGLHVPMILRWPAAFPTPSQVSPGRVDDSLLSAIDLTATTLWAAGVEHPEKMQGHTFLGRGAVDNEYVFGSRDRCDETVMRLRTVRSARYRYIRNFMPERPFTSPNAYKERMYPVLALMKELHARGRLTPPQAALMAPHRPAEELYDLEADPWEIHNLADSDDPEHQLVKAKLAAVLDRWIEEADDHGRTPEPPDVLETVRRESDAFWARWQPPR
jgi:N-sulfoglucosamine sulfohydrolase